MHFGLILLLKAVLQIMKPDFILEQKSFRLNMSHFQPIPTFTIPNG